MSIGAPSNLGTLLIQRLDAVLGTPLGQQASLAGGAGAQAVPQPGTPDATSGLQNPVQRDPQEAVDQATAQGEERTAVSKAPPDPRLDDLLGRASTLLSATQSAPTTLGYAARIILALLNTYPEADPAIHPQTPLLPAPPAPPTADAPTPPQAHGTSAAKAPIPQGDAALAERLARVLARSVQTSGLFYESHLARLATGQSPAQDLRQEPQGRLAAAPSQGPASPGLDPQLHLMVRQQLEALASQGFVWQGDAWPGAPMRWEVRHRDAHEREPRDFDGSHWATRLSLRLPELGDVQARLSLSGDQVVVRLTAGQSASRLQGALESLRSQLSARGLKATQLSVAASAGDTTDHDVHEPAAP